MMTRYETSKNTAKMNTIIGNEIEDLVTEISELVDEQGIPEIPPKE